MGHKNQVNQGQFDLLYANLKQTTSDKSGKFDKTLIDFQYRWRLNSNSLIRQQNILPIKLTRIHKNAMTIDSNKLRQYSEFVHGKDKCEEKKIYALFLTN